MAFACESVGRRARQRVHLESVRSAKPVTLRSTTILATVSQRCWDSQFAELDRKGFSSVCWSVDEAHQTALVARPRSVRAGGPNEKL
jgi:hypothetical protein